MHPFQYMSNLRSGTASSYYNCLMYIDTHSHLYEEEFREDREEVVMRAGEAGVRYIILPDIDSRSRPRMLMLCRQYPDMMFPLLGIHPTSVDGDYRDELKKMEKEAGLRSFYGIGECGIDLHWDNTFYREQIKVFEHQLGIAGELNLPVVIHSRDSLDFTLKFLRQYPYVRGIFHCFPGDERQAREAIAMGFLLGIGGVVTFKNSRMARVVGETGCSHLVLETDAPYLSPVPFRGKRNESGYIPLIAKKIAEITGEELNKIEEVTTRNAMNLFNLHSENV